MDLCSCSVSIQGGCGEVAFFFFPLEKAKLCLQLSNRIFHHSWIVSHCVIACPG